MAAKPSLAQAAYLAGDLVGTVRLLRDAMSSRAIERFLFGLRCTGIPRYEPMED